MEIEAGTVIRLTDARGLKGDLKVGDEGTVINDYGSAVLAFMQDGIPHFVADGTFEIVDEDTDDDYYDEEEEGLWDDDINQAEGYEYPFDKINDGNLHLMLLTVEGNTLTVRDGKHKGRSRCHPSDIFDARTGALVAIQRMLEDAKKDDTYFYISDSGRIVSKEYDGCEFDEAHKEYGNFFESEEKAKAAVERMRKALRDE